MKLLTGFRGFSRGTRRELRNKAWPEKATTHIDPKGRFRFLEKNTTIEDCLKLKRFIEICLKLTFISAKLLNK